LNVSHTNLALADRTKARRRLLQFLAGSPLLAGSTTPGLIAALSATLTDSASGQSFDALRAMTRKVGEIIESPEDALNVMDFEPAARKALLAKGEPTHWGYLATGVDDDATLRANHEDYNKLRVKARRLVDARKVDTRIRLFGAEYASPIFLSPVSSQGAFHPEAEIAVARAAGAKKQLMVLSTSGGSSAADVTKAHGGPIWFQLYPTDDWEVTRALIRAGATPRPCSVSDGKTIDSASHATAAVSRTRSRASRRSMTSMYRTSPTSMGRA